MLVAFDLDGVLYSSEPFLGAVYGDAIARVNAALPRALDHVPSTQEIFRHIGWPVPTIMARLFPVAGPEAVRLLCDATLEGICRRVAAGEGVLYDGVVDTLERLRGRGHELVVASNGRRRYVDTVLRTYRLTPLFGALLSVEDGALDHKAALLSAYLARHRVGPQDATLVGDRASDVEAAQAVGCGFIGCAYGHGDRAEIEGYGPTISAFPELSALLP